MDRYRPYRGRSGVSRRRRSSAPAHAGDKSTKRAVKLIICVALFVVAAFMKLVFPSALQAVGDKLNAVVNYRAAFAAIGEGISGEKKFTAALGEAFTYAFTGESPVQAEPSDTSEGDVSPPPAEDVSGADNTESSDAPPDAETFNEEETVQTFSEEASPAPSTGQDVEPVGGGEEEIPDSGKSFADAVIAAFLQNQEQYSDYAIPAGVSYGMPKLGVSYVKPVDGVVSSSFGYRAHPTESTVRFHYGTDISAEEGTPIMAFSDSKVIALGESTILGNYIILSQAGLETEYAHCDELLVKTGQAVKKGDKIATVGRSGNTAEPCLHFELRVSGLYVNPEFYIQWT